jgi:SagB-type dehydrogenase family enzyme
MTESMKRARWTVARALVFGAIASHPAPAAPLEAARETFALPSPRLVGTLSLEAVLDQRRSHREFGDGALRDDEIGQLLWAAQGITDARAGRRAAPSAGALYPLELWFVDARGTFHYEPVGHRLARMRDGDARAALAGACGQPHVAMAAIDVVIAGVSARTREKYGARAERYVLLEAGHAAENLLLQATALGLAAVPVGAFDDDRVANVLSLPAGQSPLYVLSIGRTRE